MRFSYVKRVHSKVMILFTVNVTILNRFTTELPFIYLSNCISLSESRGNISLVGAKCGADHIPYLRPICVHALWLCHKACTDGGAGSNAGYVCDFC